MADALKIISGFFQAYVFHVSSDNMSRARGEQARVTGYSEKSASYFQVHHSAEDFRMIKP